MTDTIAIAVSGGVDSLVCAYLLKQQGHDIFGVHFLTGFEKSAEPGWKEVRRLFRKMDIPVVIIDLKIPFKAEVVDYFTAAYQDGKTPNPCLVCNPTIKFGALLAEVRRLGASRLATGHYARVEADQEGRYRLCKGLDKDKDQSYFLSRLTQDQLARACFPLGIWTKEKVKALAAEKGLQPVSAKESQDVCFIKDVHYAEFLIRSNNICKQSGDIVDAAGNRVGCHDGLHRYTVGQRRGINCPAGQAYYVVRIDIRHNRLVVGSKADLCTQSCRVTDMNWIIALPENPILADTRIRYRHRAVVSMVSPVGHDGAVVRFEQAQTAVAPGQGAVFYRGDEVIGGGWIVGTTR